MKQLFSRMPRKKHSTKHQAPSVVINGSRLLSFTTNQLASHVSQPFRSLVLQGDFFEETFTEAEKGKAAASLKANHSLTEITFQKSLLFSRLLAELAEGLEDNSLIKKLVLIDCSLPPESAKDFANLMTNLKALEECCIMNIQSQGKDLWNLLEAARSAQSVEVLASSISGNPHLISVLAHPSSCLVKLALEDVKMSTNIFGNFCKALETSDSVEEIFLYKLNVLDDSQMLKLTKALQFRERSNRSPPKVTLKASICPYGDIGAFGITELLKSTTRTSILGVRGCYVSDIGFRKLCSEAEKADCLRYISVRLLKNVTYKGWCALSMYLRNSSRLEDIWVTESQSGNLMEAFDEAVKNTSHVTVTYKAN